MSKKNPKSANFEPNGCGRHHNAIGYTPKQEALGRLAPWIRPSVNFRAGRWAVMSANRLEEGAGATVGQSQSVVVYGHPEEWWAMTRREEDALIKIAQHLGSSGGRGLREIRVVHLSLKWPFLQRLIAETPENVALEIWGEHGCIAILPDGTKYIRIDTGSLARMRARHATAAGASG
tara:strand:+ start:371 stop:901 length:531 start_codon:yes stop_codon:yes gene_type:complete